MARWGWQATRSPDTVNPEEHWEPGTGNGELRTGNSGCSLLAAASRCQPLADGRVLLLRAARCCHQPHTRFKGSEPLIPADQGL